MTGRPFLTYLVSALPTGSWFVETVAGTSCQSFPSLEAAKRYAVALARCNGPSTVLIVGSGGEILGETIFDELGEQHDS